MRKRKGPEFILFGCRWAENHPRLKIIVLSPSNTNMVPWITSKLIPLFESVTKPNQLLMCYLNVLIDIFLKIGRALGFF